MQPEESHEPDPVPGDAVPWTARDVWLGVGSLVAWWLVMVAVALAARFTDTQVDPGLFIGAGELLLLLPVWWFARRKYGAGWEALGLRSFEPGILALGLGLLLVSFLFNGFYASVLAQFGLRAQIDLVPIMAQLSSPWLLLLAGVIVAPLAEELFFRGFCFAGLQPRYGWRKAAAISSGLFALFHLQPLALLPIFLLGYLFAFLYQRSRSLWPAILLHMLVNALGLGAAYLAAEMGITPGMDPTDFLSPLPTSSDVHYPLPTVGP